MELAEVFVAALESSVSVSCTDRKSYDSLRTSLVRKLRKYNETQSSFGLPSDTYLKASFNQTTSVGTFSIVPLEDRIRKKSYTVYDI